MADPAAADYLADLTTAPIFGDAVFLSEALDLPEGQNEEQLENELVLAAQDAGVEDPYSFLFSAPNPVTVLDVCDSSTTVSSIHRSSMSIRSRESQSTGVTSHPSRTSKDLSSLEGLSALRIAAQPRISVSSDDYYDVMTKRFRSNAKSRTASPVSDAPSVLSDSSTTPRKHKRASSLFSRFRKESRHLSRLGLTPPTQCLNSPRTSRSHERCESRSVQVILECGHVLSKSLVGACIAESLCSKGQTAPSCCGRPLPKSVVEAALTKPEVGTIANLGSQSPDTRSLKDSAYGEEALPRCSFADSRRSTSTNLINECSLSEEAEIDPELFKQLLENDTFRSLRAQQKDQFRRISLFESHQRKALSAYHTCSLKRLKSELESNKEAKIKQHATELERLDEFQIMAEHDLRKAHAQEAQNVATALKYMEAYCSGTNPTNPDLAHTVTEEDRKKLARQHLTQRKLPAKHESAINVLRARQEIDLKTKLQKQEDELQLLQSAYEQEKQRSEAQHARDVARLEALAEFRRKRVKHQWNLRFETWKRGWEKEHGAPLIGRFPDQAWEHEPAEARIDPSSSLSLYLQIAQ